MLSEERQARILELVNKHRTITVQELTDALDSSPATIRRDLTTLHKQGLLQKVHGGAVSNESSYATTEPDFNTKSTLFRDEKTAIAKAAAALIEDHDFVFIDAGTTTEAMLPFVTARQVTYVTNGTAHAAWLASHSCSVILLGGQVKAVTGAVIGHTALTQLDSFNFTKGFFGTNGISLKSGFTTPDPAEAAIKEKALKQCHYPYVVSDPSKFDVITPITFAKLGAAAIITTKAPNEGYYSETAITEVSVDTTSL
ncbi:MAG: DeoR/GlpR transcriptional regulator [Veillonella sp.]|uniref:DeoR/GlpR family DNA-binding transcription regulator n=1 Tax=Veillonella sp. TaxID=1926307 RepID=UPI0025E99371|nr:DeoR/GlpR family DNA-binding transcription regulator [Veillonella sp.]MBS4913047.1 DeoR/GlpR transcriptional regulator [Veillonella sp.]